MIYLIGGPPRCGKTTLAKELSKKLNISWISSDALEVIARGYINKKDHRKFFPYSYLRKEKGARNNDEFYNKYSADKIIKVLKLQSLTANRAVEMLIANEIDNPNDYIIEGYHITPTLAKKFIKKYGRKNIKAIFLTKHNVKKFAIDVHQSTTQNDWLLVLTKKPETFLSVGAMVAKYSDYFEKEAKNVGLKVFDMDNNFQQQLQKAVQYLSQT